jgi:hypothetical protein
MAGRFLDKPLYRVVALGIEERSRDTHVADVALEDESCGLRAHLLGTKLLSSPAAPKGYLRLGAHIENPGHHSVGGLSNNKGGTAAISTTSLVRPIALLPHCHHLGVTRRGHPNTQPEGEATTIRLNQHLP